MKKRTKYIYFNSIVTLIFIGIISANSSFISIVYAQPSINIESVQCSNDAKENVNIQFNISGVEHDSQPLTYTVEVISPTGTTIHKADVNIPADAPNPATTTIGFSLPPLSAGTYTIKASINDNEITKTFKAPNCSGNPEPNTNFKNQGQCIKDAKEQTTKEDFKRLKDICKNTDFKSKR